MWELSVEEQIAACWMRRLLFAGCWSTASARGWSAWGCYVWRVSSSITYWERNMISPYQNYGEVEAQQPVVWYSRCACQIQHSHSYKNSTFCGQTAGGDSASPRGAWLVSSTHVWVSDRGGVSVGCGPLNRPVSPGSADAFLFFICAFPCVLQVSFIYNFQYVWHDSFLCTSTLLWHDSFICKFFVCVTCLIHM